MLDVEEMETLYGWRNGRYFAESVKDGIRIEEAVAQSWLYSPDWNMMRVTRRGPGLPAEWFTGDNLSHFFYIKFR